MGVASVGLRVWRTAPTWSTSALARVGELGKGNLEAGWPGVFRRAIHVPGARADGDVAPVDPIAGPMETSNLAVQKMHRDLLETMKGRRIPPSALVSSLLHQCSTSGDIQLAMEVIAQLRITRAVQGQQQANFDQNLSKLVVAACLQAQDSENALKTLRAHNIYGFTPSLEAAHQILAYARNQQDLPLMKKTMKTMVSNSIAPTRNTAEIALRICKDQGDEKLLFSMAKEFHEIYGLDFRPALYDLCISTAANAGDVKHVMEILRWRSKLKLPSTIASTFALAKAHILNGKPKDAAQLIHNKVQESEERNMYFRVLVRAWPTEVLARRIRCRKEATLKTNIEAMFEELQALGCRVLVDATQEFGTGTETVRKVVYG